MSSLTRYLINLIQLIIIKDFRPIFIDFQGFIWYEFCVKISVISVISLNQFSFGYKGSKPISNNFTDIYKGYLSLSYKCLQKMGKLRPCIGFWPIHVIRVPIVSVEVGLSYWILVLTSSYWIHVLMVNYLI